MGNRPLKYGMILFLTISFINLLIILLFSIFWKSFPNYSFTQFFIFILASIFSGLLISLAIIFISPIFGDYLITFRRLLRLENLSHPLILRLSLEAPGTYHHSLGVSNLASKAAKSIGADSLLARVGAYYHDAGKLKNPGYYIENQKTEENVHEEINDPKKSAQIIIDHVSYGLKLADEYKLPKEISAFMPEHHGTTLISFFYNLAKEKNLKPKKEDFRYPGPKPLSREAAIIMLADAIEAKVRLLDKVDKEKVTQIVDEIIKERLDDKQLELSGINDQMLIRIRRSFIETLLVMFHQRIEYPDKKNHYGKFAFKNLFKK